MNTEDAFEEKAMNPLSFLRRLRKPPVDYTEEAIALFQRFALRHGLKHVELKAPVEVMWEFPIQQGLAFPLTLGLQNIDELNLGLPGFWSYFFPFASVAPKFEHCLDAWITGQARIARRPHRGLFRMTSASILETLEGGEWQVAYTYVGIDWPHATDVIQNGTSAPSA